MIASRTAARPADFRVMVCCKVPGGPWFVGLSGPGGQEVELGPYENPAIARADAAKLRQLLASMTSAPGATKGRGSDLGVPAEYDPQQGGLCDASKDEA